MLLVNEIYGLVKQGEGKSAGMDCVFLRLSGCNLACTYCDTPYTWNWFGTAFQHPQKFDKTKEVHKMGYSEVVTELERLCKGSRKLVVTGGEPLLQQKQLSLPLGTLHDAGWWIEVETNGTIIPDPLFVSVIDQFNCSPKFTNAGEIDNPREKRLKWEALVAIRHSGKATFKFVITSDKDLEELQEIVSIVDIPANMIWLMPEGKTRAEQIARQDQVKELAEKNGYNFTPRLHVLEFDNKRAV